MRTDIIPRSAWALETALPYELSYIPDALRRRAKSELFEDEDTIVKSLQLMRSMLRDETDFCWPDDDLFLLSFLRARKFNVKRASDLVMKFYRVKIKHDELYSNFNFDDVNRTVSANFIGFLPYRDSEGCCILLMRGTTWNPHDNSFADIMRLLTCALLHANLSPATQIAGFKVIVDFSGFTLRHLPHVSPSYLWLFAEALQGTFPGRFRAVHFVNEGHLWSSIWAVLKHLLTKKIKNRFFFHGKNEKKLHKYFSPSILPEEYGGEMAPFDNSEWGAKMNAKSGYITSVISYGFGKYSSSRTQEKNQ